MVEYPRSLVAYIHYTTLSARQAGERNDRFIETSGSTKHFTVSVAKSARNNS